MTATMHSTPTEAPRRGRPRRADADQAILTATVELLGEVGVAGFSMDLLAQRAGVGKATIYRRWPSKEALMLEAMRTVVTPITVPDTGAVHTDLRGYVGQLRVSLEDYLRNRQTTVRTIIRRGIDRGELAADTDVDLLVDLVLGPF